MTYAQHQPSISLPAITSVFFPWDDYCLIKIEGKDCHDFLNRLMTNKIPPPPGRQTQAFILTPQAKPLLECWLWATNESLVMEVRREQAQEAVDLLEQYHFTEDVHFNNLGHSYRGLLILGEQYPTNTHLPQAPLPAGEVESWAGGWRCGQLRLHGRGDILWLPEATFQTIYPQLNSHGWRELSKPELEFLRIANGYPRYRLDYDQNTLFLEFAPKSAYSENKGCYPGQEVVARVLHRGHVNKRLRGLRLKTGPLLQPDDIATQDNKTVLKITSTTVHPEAGCIALGYVRHELLADPPEITTTRGSVVKIEERPFARD